MSLFAALVWHDDLFVQGKQAKDYFEEATQWSWEEKGRTLRRKTERRRADRIFKLLCKSDSTH